MFKIKKDNQLFVCTPVMKHFKNQSIFICELNKNIETFESNTLPTNPIIKPNNLINVINNSTSNYIVSLDITPTGSQPAGWSTIIRFTYGSATNDDNGDFRVPGIFFNAGTTQLAVCIGLSNGNIQTFYTGLLPLNKPTNVVLTCIDEINKLVVKDIGTYSVINKYRTESRGRPLNVFAGDSRFPAAKATISNLTYNIAKSTLASITPNPIIKPNNLINVINNTTSNYIVSLDITPTGSQPAGWSTIVRFTYGSATNDDNGDFRVPAVFFNAGTTQLAVCIGLSNGNIQTFYTGLLPLNKSTNVMITCIGETNEVVVKNIGTYSILNKYRTEPKGRPLNVFVTDARFPQANATIANLTYKIL